MLEDLSNILFFLWEIIVSKLNKFLEIPVSLHQIWMFEAVHAGSLDFSETVEIKLTDEALKLIVAEIFGKNFGLYFFLIQDIDHSGSGVPADDMMILLILNK